MGKKVRLSSYYIYGKNIISKDGVISTKRWSLPDAFSFVG